MALKNLKNQVLEWISNDSQEIVNLTSALIACKSDRDDTTKAMNVVKDFLNQRGLAFEEMKIHKTMPNLIASTHKRDSKRHLMFNGHLDTMPAGSEAGWIHNPYSGRIENGKIYGRGAQDMKAGVAAMLFAYSYLARLKNRLNGTISLSIVSDEESGYGRGSGYCFEKAPQKMLASCVLSAEPSGIDAISFASKGYMVLNVVVQTKGAIAGYSNESENAIFIALQIINALKSLEKMKVSIPHFLKDLLNHREWLQNHQRLRGKDHAQLLSQISVDIGTIEGGDFACTIPPLCRFSVSLVLPLGSNIYEIYAKAREIVCAYPQAQLYLEGVSGADVCNPKDEIAQIVQKIVQELGKDKPKMTPEIALSDCRYWRYRGIPSFWYGVDGNLCSCANENVQIDELLHITRTHTLSALEYLCAIQEHCPKPLVVAPPKAKSPTIKNIAPFYALCLKGSAKSFSDKHLNTIIEKSLEKLYAALRAENLPIAGSCFAHFETQNTSKNAPLEVIVGIPLSKISPKMLKNIQQMHMEWIFFPCSKAATIAHFGDLAVSQESWNLLQKYCKTKQLKVKGSYTEFYIINAPEPKNLWVSELQLNLED